MSMFQTSVLKNIHQDESIVALRWAEYQKYVSKIEFIRTVKEEKYQDGFLKDIFENCLGYTLDSTNPNDFNLEREKKNETDGKKADGVIYVDNKVIGIVELKAQDTKNLDKIELQAFNYHNSHSNSKYIIISNFDELRFYIDKKTAYERFSLFNLNYDEFKKLHLLLSYESIKENLPQKLKEKSATFEKDISDRLYKDFSLFRTHLFENIVKNNNLDKALLLRLTQKLCDRIIFILFAEDKLLIPENTIKNMRTKFKNDDFGDRTLYDFYKNIFKAINQGNERLNIPKYSGGLFLEDKTLDSLIIDDYILDEEAKVLSDYDFESEVSVNILGHIFEQSLTDLEEINASINEETFDNKKSKRKKDGVFYTPEYITKYIVDNTLGKLCNHKKEELQLTEIVPPKNFKKPTKKEQLQKDNLEKYRNWLLNLKILDPACGSGAFLNQALEFLINEHKSLQKDLVVMGDITAYYEIEKNILENNLYGVDINEDAVEIAKLSLWLRTATKGRELTKLANKILVANSLLDMPFEEGIFDVVIGNPPYVRVQGLKSNYEDETKLYEEKYKSASGKYDLYVLFLEMSFKMLNKKGLLSYILPHKFLVSDFGKGIREFLSENKAVESLLHFGSEMVFEDAAAYTCIITLSHNNEKLYFKSLKPNEIFNDFTYDFISYNKINNNKWNLTNKNISNILEKINEQSLRVKDVFKGIFQGIKTGDDKIFVMKGKIENNYFIGYSNKINKNIKIEKNIVKPVLKGEDIKKYAPLKTDLYIIYPHYLDKEGKTKPYSENELKEKYPLAYEYLLNFKEELVEKKIKYKTNPIYWFSLHRARELSLINQEKLLTPDVSFRSNMSLDNNQSCHIGQYNLIKNSDILEDYKFYLSILNSSLMWFFIKNTSTEFRGGFFVYQTKYIEPFPLPKLESLEQQEPFILKSDVMLELTKNLQETKQNFINELELEKVSKKLQSFEELTFDEFIKEYKKAKKLKFADKLEERNFKNEWKALFENDSKIALDLKSQINITDKEIDKMVYELYGLSDDEIKIVEG